jgi:hypothetical protein
MLDEHMRTDLVQDDLQMAHAARRSPRQGCVPPDPDTQDEPPGRKHLDDGGFATTGSFFATMKTRSATADLAHQDPRQARG